MIVRDVPSCSHHSSWLFVSNEIAAIVGTKKKTVATIAGNEAQARLRQSKNYLALAKAKSRSRNTGTHTQLTDNNEGHLSKALINIFTFMRRKSLSADIHAASECFEAQRAAYKFVQRPQT